MARVLEGSGKPLVITSGTLLVAFGRSGVATEMVAPVTPELPRSASETIVMPAARKGVRSSIVRLSPSVHGRGDHGFVPFLMDIARRKGFSAYVGEGKNRWPAVHRLDAAHLFRLALEKAPPGTRLHGVAEEGVPMRSIAETIGAGLKVPVRSITLEEAPAHFEWITPFVTIDGPTSRAITREAFGWSPMQPDLLTDMKENEYLS